MPSKSKRNRRNITQTRPVGNTTVNAAVTGEPVPSTAAPPVYRSSRTTAAETPIVYGSFSKDIKWIGLVAAIVVILLIIAYYLFR